MFMMPEPKKHFKLFLTGAVHKHVPISPLKCNGKILGC